MSWSSGEPRVHPCPQAPPCRLTSSRRSVHVRSLTVMLGVLGLTIGVGVIVSTVRELSLEMARNLRVTESKGLIVTNGDKCSPADEAGMRRGDVLGEVYQQQVEKVR